MTRDVYHSCTGSRESIVWQITKEFSGYFDWYGKSGTHLRISIHSENCSLEWGVKFKSSAENSGVSWQMVTASALSHAHADTFLSCLVQNTRISINSISSPSLWGTVCRIWFSFKRFWLIGVYERSRTPQWFVAVILPLFELSGVTKYVEMRFVLPTGRTTVSLKFFCQDKLCSTPKM